MILEFRKAIQFPIACSFDHKAQEGDNKNKGLNNPLFLMKIPLTLVQPRTFIDNGLFHVHF